MTLEEAQNSLQQVNMQYFIVGVKRDKQNRSIPPKYEMNGVPVNDTNIFHVMKEFETFRIFDVTENTAFTEEEFKEKMNDFFNVETERQEKELLARLKEKYESKIVQMNYDV